MSTPGTGMRFARARMLTVGIHSAASGFWRWISTSRPARFVDPLRPSPFEYTGSRVAGGAGYPQRKESADRARKRVSTRTGWWQSLPPAACHPISHRLSPSKYTVPQVVSAAGHRHRRESADRARKRVSTRTGWRQSLPPAACHPISHRRSPSIYTVPRVVSAAGYPHRRESLDRAQKRVSKHTGGRQPLPPAACHAISHRRSPSIYTVPRVVSAAGYPHRRESADRARKRVSKRTGWRQSLPRAACRPIGHRRSPSNYTVPQVVSAAGYPHCNAHGAPDRARAPGDVVGRTAASGRASGQSDAHTHHCIPQRVESLERSRMRDEIRTFRTTCSRSPLECTTLRSGSGPGCRRRDARVA